MRLLTCTQDATGKVTNLLLKEFIGSSIPPYTILSHRWGADNEEVSFKDLEISNQATWKKKGWTKIANCCLQSLKDGFQYTWVDTCCIDKSSSAELSEGINSMYVWYGESTICYAYLEDVPSSEDPRKKDSAFRKSVWFTRGWTLQELMAPSSVIFCANDWTEIGSKASLADVIESITGINRKCLVRNSSMQVSIATRMSWAAKRQTARIEDRAYSLLGIFGVNMPAIYGEGIRAFQRLQNEILKVSNDQTIFAWQDTQGFFGGRRKMLADSPDYFVDSTQFEPMDYNSYMHVFELSNPRMEYTMTNFGLRIQLRIISLETAILAKEFKDFFGGQGYLNPTSRQHHKNLHVAFLACTHGVKQEPVWMFLQQSGPAGHYSRTTLLLNHVIETSRSTRSIATGAGLLNGLGIQDFKFRRGFAQAALLRTEEVLITHDDPSVFSTLETPSVVGSFSARFNLDLSGSSFLEVVGYSPGAAFKKDGKKGNNFLVLRGKNIHDIILLECRKSNERYALALGRQNNRVWSHLATYKRNEKALDIKVAYDKGGHLAHWCSSGLDWVKVPRGEERGSIVVTTRRTRNHNYGADEVYAVKIVASDKK